MSEHFVAYKDIKELQCLDAVEKTAEEKAAEDAAHKKWKESLGEVCIAANNKRDQSTEEKVVNIKSSGLGIQNVLHEVDPRQSILDSIDQDALNKLNLYGAQVLVATYVRPEKLKSGLIITSKVRDEDKFQGKCGLVLKTGPLAFVENEKLKFAGCKANVGDWVWYRPMDGFALSLAGNSDAVHCRVLDDVEIRGDLGHPDVIL